MSETLYDFEMRVVDRDPDGYYVTRWDRATPLTVQARSRDDAFKKAFEVMGPSPRYRLWTARIDRITQVRAEAGVSDA